VLTPPSEDKEGLMPWIIRRSLFYGFCLFFLYNWSDFIGNPCSSIVDLSLTAVVQGNLLKVVAWYDNEWAYSNRLVELTADVAKLV